MTVDPEPHSTPGVVELREDVPLKPSGVSSSGRLCSGGPRLILAAFAVLSVAITIALLTQIYYGDYEVVPHGSVSSSAATCSSAGTAAMQSGGRAADGAIATALCLAVLAPHRTSLDASGSLVYWEYGSSRSQLPTIIEWGGVESITATTTERLPRLLVAMAALHSRFGVLTWSQALQPAIDLAREGFPVSRSLSAAAEERGIPGFVPQALRKELELAEYLETFQHNSSTELCSAWSCSATVIWRENAAPVAAGMWRVWAAGAGGDLAAKALSDALTGDPVNITTTSAFQGVIKNLQGQFSSVNPWPGGVASGLAVVDPKDTYIALVTGLSVAFGSEAITTGTNAWVRDEPAAPLDLAPAIIIDQHICGTRYIMGAESGEALAEGAALVLAGASTDAVNAVESARVLILADGALGVEPGKSASMLPGALLVPLNTSVTLPALNFVQQKGDALLSHADSRGGGVASRF